MALIRVTSEDLATVASQLSSGSEEIDSQLTTMRGLVQSLVASDWQGAASSAFDTL
jgi:WXG100 family type VII secretion target